MISSWRLLPLLAAGCILLTAAVGTAFPAGTAGSAPPGPTGVITLEAARAAALAASPTLAASAGRVEAAAGRLGQAGLFPNPELRAEAESFAGSGAFRGTEELEYKLLLSQPLELGGKRGRRVALARREQELAELEHRTARLDLLERVTASFYELLAAQERLELARERVGQARQVREAVAARLEAGKVSPVELTRAGVPLATAELAERGAEARLMVARRLLAAAWGADSARFERAEGSLEAPVSIPALPELEAALQSPELARAAAEVRRREAALALVRAAGIPDLELGGGLQRFQGSGEQALVLELGLPLPLFDRRQGDSRAAAFELEVGRHELAAQQVELRRALHEGWQELALAHAEATVLRDQVVSGAREVFEAVTIGYAQGKFDYLALLDAQRTLVEAREAQLEVQARYHRAAARVDRLAGGSALESGSNNRKERER